MDAGTYIAIILGVVNIALGVALALRKESKEESKRREDDCRKREEKLDERIQACDRERDGLMLKVAIMAAKQEMWDQLLPQFKLVQSIPGGQRGYDPRPPQGTGERPT